MIRLLLLLCAGLFLTLQIGGQDRGQKRIGLVAAERAPVRVVAPPVDEPQESLMSGLVQPAAAAEAEIVPVTFAPAQPVMVPVATDLAADTAAEPVAAPGEAVKYVQGRSVNVRSGPSTRDAVVGRLTRGEAVSVVWVEDNGWARVRLEGDGLDGYMSMSFLADNAP